MDPHHLLLLLNVKDGSGELLVNVLIFLPELTGIQVVFNVIESLEVVEKWSQDCLMEIKEVFDGIRIEEYWDATVWFEDLCDFLGLLLILGDDSRPANAHDLDHLLLLS